MFGEDVAQLADESRVGCGDVSGVALDPFGQPVQTRYRSRWIDRGLNEELQQVDVVVLTCRPAGGGDDADAQLSCRLVRAAERGEVRFVEPLVERTGPSDDGTAGRVVVENFGHRDEAGIVEAGSP